MPGTIRYFDFVLVFNSILIFSLISLLVSLVYSVVFRVCFVLRLVRCLPVRRDFRADAPVMGHLWEYCLFSGETASTG